MVQINDTGGNNMKRALAILVTLMVLLGQIGFAAAEGEKTIVIQTYTDNGNLTR